VLQAQPRIRSGVATAEIFCDGGLELQQSRPARAEYKATLKQPIGCEPYCSDYRRWPG